MANLLESTQIATVFLDRDFCIKSFTPTARDLFRLVEDATWSMPPLATWYRGLEAISVFLDEHPLRQRWRHVPTSANGQPALLCYMWNPTDGVFRAEALDVLTFAGTRIAAIDAFRDPAVHASFGRPLELEH